MKSNAENRSVLSILETVVQEVNAIHFLIDEGYVDRYTLKIKTGISIKDLNERLDEEFGMEKTFSSKKDLKKWLLALSEELKNLSGLIKFTIA